MKLLKAMATIASFTMLSRIAGMARDMLTAYYVGASPVGDAFFVALKLPNLFRRVVGEGAFSVAFVPLYSKISEENGDEEAAKFAGEIFSVMALILSILTVIVMIGMPWIIHLISPGFNHGTERYDLAVTMTRLTFPYLLLMSLTALFGGMLHTHGKFAPFAAAPIIFNITLIAAILVFASYFPTIGHAMACGVTVSGIIQLVMMVYFTRRHKIKFKFQKPKFGDNTKKLFKLMGPGVFSAGVFQINLFVDMMLASTLPAGAISYLYYADRLNQLPLSMIGIAVGTALLPMLSKSIASNNAEESKDLFNRSLELCFFVAMPATVALLIIPYELVSILFERGSFSVKDTLQTSYVLMGYGMGLPAYVASKIFMTAFWAHHDTVNPVKISIITALVNAILSFILIGLLGVTGLAIATGIAGWVQVYLLHKHLKGKDTLEFDERLKMVIPKIAISSCIMGIVLSFLSHVLHPYFSGLLWREKIPALVALLAGGAISYAVCANLTGILKFNDIQKYLKRRK